MPDDELETIGAFARRVGMTPSALRFYDECGLLVPAVVDAGSGYRRYAGEQRGRAVALRRLREARVPLAAAPVVLDGDPAAAVEALREHLRRTADDDERARRAATGLLAELAARGAVEAERTRVVLVGRDLAGAVRHVVPAAAPPEELEDPHRGLACARLEVAAGEVTLVATDRVRMAVRTLVPVEGEGPDAAVCLPAGELGEIAAWASSRHEVSVLLGPAEAPVVLAAGGEERELAAVAAPYPDWRAVLGRVRRPRARAVVSRRRLLDEVIGDDGRPVVLETSPDRARVTVRRPGGPAVDVLGTCTGAGARVALDPVLLTSALVSAVGPDVVLELVGPCEAVVVRSADAGTATTLVMPLGEVPGVVDVAADAPEPTGSGR